MSIAKEQISDLNWKITVQVPSEDYKPKVDSSVKDYSKKINLKGFRAGKVPAGIVKKMYGKEILAEELNKLVNDSLTGYLKDEDLKILGDPLPITKDDQSLDLETGKTYEFEFELGLQPDFDLSPLSKKPSLTKHVIKVTDEMVNDEVENLQRRYGKMTNPAKIEDDKDALYVKLEELDNEGNVKEDGATNDPAIPVDLFKGKVAKKAKELQKGDTLDIDIFKSFDKEKKETLKHLLNIEDEEAEVGSMFRMTVQNINHLVPAELDEEFFAKVYGEDVKTEEAFRGKIREELENLMGTYSDQQLHNDMIEWLLEKIDMDLPEDFLKRWLKFSNKEELTDEQLEKEFTPFLNNLKWTLVVNRISEDRGIHVHKEDIEQRTKELIKMEYGLQEEDETGAHYLKELTSHLMQNQEHVQKVYEQLRDNRVFASLRDEFTLKDKSISFDKFKELRNKK